jgi:hypothetical protein
VSRPRALALAVLAVLGASAATAGGMDDDDREDAGVRIGRLAGPRPDGQAAALVHPSDRERRPGNAPSTRRVPTARELHAFRRGANDWGACRPMLSRVTGRYTGTTDEILQWAAAKWRLPADLLRAVAVVETNWNARFVGDDGASFGLLQIKRTASPSTYPLAGESVAFNADYYAASVRYYLDGCATWLGGSYRAGDLPGSVGAWYSGDWHDDGARAYVEKVREQLVERRWDRGDF